MYKNFVCVDIVLGLQELDGSQQYINTVLRVVSKKMVTVKTGSLLELVVTDGINRARMVAWNALGKFFAGKLDISQSYVFKDVQVRAANEQYLPSGAVPYELLLASGVNITPAPTPIISEGQVLTKLGDLSKHMGKKVDVVIVVKSLNDVKPVSTPTRSGAIKVKQEIVICDDSQRETTATLWGDEPKVQIKEGDVLTLNNASVSKYGNKPVLHMSRSDMSANESEKLHLSKWYKRNGTKTVPIAAKRMEEHKEFFPISKLSFLQTGESMPVQGKLKKIGVSTYMACTLCKSGLVQMGEDKFCQKCKKTTQGENRAIFKLAFEGFPEEIKLFHDNAEPLVRGTMASFIQFPDSDYLERLKGQSLQMLVIIRPKFGTREFVCVGVEIVTPAKKRKQ